MPTRFRVHEVLATVGMAQMELHRRSHVSFTTINRMANNHTRQVSLDTLDAIAGVLGVAPGDLLAHDTPKPAKSKRRR